MQVRSAETVCNTPSQTLKSLQGLRGQMGMYLRCKLPEVWVATNSPATDIVRSSERAAIVDKVEAMLKARTPAVAVHPRSLRASSSVRCFWRGVQPQSAAPRANACGCADSV